REERIGVRGQRDELLKVRETRHGPVISDLRGGSGPALAVAMANLAPGNTGAAGLFALNRAKNVDDARPAAAAISSPIQNLLVADSKRIALYVTGRVPIRRSGDGSAPVPGADGAHDWIGWATGDQLPHVVEPASGRLVNANERIAPPDFPVFLGRDWFGDWRARRIRQLLDESQRHTAAGFARMQLDVRSAFALQILPTLLSVQVQPGLPARALDLLQHWDGSMAMDLPQPLIFSAWVQHFRDQVLGRAGVPRSAAGPTHEFVAFVLSPAGAHWCGEQCGPILAQSLEKAVSDLASRFGDDPAAWRWREAHQAVFAHPILGRVPLLGSMTTARIDSPGGDTTIGRGGLPWEGFQSVEGPSYRGVYDLADLNQSLFIVTPGQSGNPVSSHSRDFLRRWRDGDTITLGPEPRRVAATIRLNPT
ncbi:MAG: penicillin acylase family protein, partial [Acetobacteraceae bacterium]|nr:penicillin acylase family protein [Acetobacteraceae bacterium]